MDYNKLTRSSRTITIDKIGEGKAPDMAIRLGLSEMFMSMARAVEKVGLEEVFCAVFPLRLTLSSDVSNWDFKLIAKLENKVAE